MEAKKENENGRGSISINRKERKERKKDICDRHFK